MDVGITDIVIKRKMDVTTPADSRTIEWTDYVSYPWMYQHPLQRYSRILLPDRISRLFNYVIVTQVLTLKLRTP